MTEPRVALLIDADNLSSDVIEQAIEHVLKLYGAIHFRRAYASPQKVVEYMELFKRLGIRPMVNVPTGKNSTDIALAVDAIDLAISERPGVVVIASSDSDYAPLAQRLREKGCRVMGIGQLGKTGSDSPQAYDEFIDLAHRKARARSEPKAPAQEARAAPVRASTVRRGRAAQRDQPPAAALAPEVLAVLLAAPSLRTGSTVQLNEVADALRRHEVLTGKRASASRWLKRWPLSFELMPPDKPRTVRYLGATDA